MAALLILSVDKGAGKTAISAVLAKRLAAGNKKIAFLKVAHGAVDSDSAFMKQSLCLAEDISQMTSTADDLKEAYARLSSGKHVVIVEGLISDVKSKQIYSELAKDGKIVLVEAYQSNHPEVYEDLAANMLGVIINKVPQSQLKKTREAEAARLKSAGVSLLGVIPEDRALLAPSVRQLAEGIQGKILSSVKKSNRLVENVMLGAMCVDSGVIYYSRKPAKAAVLRADRPDMQLAALETDTACLVLADSSSPPIHSVAFKAENRGIPLITTEKKVNDVISQVEEILVMSQFAEEQKLPRMTEIMRQNIEVRAIFSALGVMG